MLIRLTLSLSIILSAVSCLKSDDPYDPNFVEKGNSFPEKTLSLTYDDGPTEISLKIGQFLAAYDIRATFFINGNKVAGNEHILEKLVKMGHLIGNHTWSHKALDTISDKRILDEIIKTHDIIKHYTPDKSKQFLRPPFGRFDQRVSNILEKAGLNQYSTAVHWDIGGEISRSITADWKCWREDIEPRYCANAMENETDRFGKGIVLFHDVDPRSFKLTVSMVGRWKKNGYRFVRLDELLDSTTL